MKRERFGASYEATLAVEELYVCVAPTANCE